jgi:glutamyl/glutaminyl-tRNA synthetase
LADALLNFTALIGWSAGGDQEIFSKADLIRLFTLSGVQKSGGVFDYAKLEWMNGVHLRSLTTEEFIKQCAPFLVADGLTDEVTPGAFAMIAPAVQERVKTLAEVSAWVGFLYNSKPFEPDWSSAFVKGMTKELAQEIIPEIINKWRSAPFEADLIEQAIKDCTTEKNLKLGQVFGLIRIAVLGSKHTPPLGLSLQALGLSLSTRRLSIPPII